MSCFRTRTKPVIFAMESRLSSPKIATYKHRQSVSRRVHLLRAFLHRLALKKCGVPNHVGIKGEKTPPDRRLEVELPWATVRR
jgi:hypothetical protein